MKTDAFRAVRDAVRTPTARCHEAIKNATDPLFTESMIIDLLSRDVPRVTPVTSDQGETLFKAIPLHPNED